MMDNMMYQKIYDEINKFILPDCKEIIIYMEYGKASYSFSFYEKINEKYIKCYDIPGVTDDALMESFGIIDSLVAPERNKMKEKWSNMTVVITADGDMKADMDYTDLTEGSYEYKKKWKKKYL